MTRSVRRWRHPLILAAQLVVVAGHAGAQMVPPAPAAAPELPVAPPVQDPLLEPPPEPPRQLRSWAEALSLVRSRSPDYRATLDSVLQAEAQARAALAGVLPTLGAEGSFTHQLFTASESFAGRTVSIPPQNVFSAAGHLRYPIVDARGYWAAGTARRGVDSARLELAEKRRLIAQAVVRGMVATLAARRVAELNRTGLRAALQRLVLTRQRARIGAGNQLDVDRAEQDVLAARSPIITGDESLRQTWEALGLALGLPTPVSAPGDLQLAGFVEAVARTCRMRRSVEERTDVLAARKRLEIAARNVDEAWLRYAPTVALQSDLSWASGVVYGPNTTWSVQGVLSVPIWEGGVRYATLRSARAARDQAEQSLVAVRLSALVEVAQSYRAVGVTAASREVARRTRDLAQRIDQRTRTGYIDGVGTSLDLVTSAQALRQADLSLALLEYRAVVAQALAILANAECVY